MQRRTTTQCPELTNGAHAFPSAAPHRTHRCPKRQMHEPQSRILSTCFALGFQLSIDRSDKTARCMQMPHCPRRNELSLLIRLLGSIRSRLDLDQNCVNASLRRRGTMPTCTSSNWRPALTCWASDVMSAHSASRIFFCHLARTWLPRRPHVHGSRHTENGCATWSRSHEENKRQERGASAGRSWVADSEDDYHDIAYVTDGWMTESTRRRRKTTVNLSPPPLILIINLSIDFWKGEELDRRDKGRRR